MELSDKIKHAISLLEDATTASLAPFPVEPIGNVVRVSNKDKTKPHAKEEKQHSNKYL